jgi:hypothetical protein
MITGGFDYAYLVVFWCWSTAKDGRNTDYCNPVSGSVHTQAGHGRTALCLYGKAHRKQAFRFDAENACRDISSDKNCMFETRDIS